MVKTGDSSINVIAIQASIYLAYDHSYFVQNLSAQIDQNPYQSTFYNGTIEVTEAGGLLSVELVFFFCLGIALIGLLIFWTRSQIQQFSKKTKKAPKVEVGTMATDTSMDEWLQGTSYTQSASTKLRKK